MTTRAQFIETFCEQAEAAGEASIQRRELAASRSEIARLRDALAERDQEIATLRDEVCRLLSAGVAA